MENKDYALVASLGIYQHPELSFTTQNYTLPMEAFGIRKGQELTADQVKENGSMSILGLLKTMKRPSPITIIWQPPVAFQGLFAEVRRKKLRLEISFVRSGNNTNHPDVINLMTLDNVRISHILPEIKKGSKSRYERIEATFTKLDLN